MAPNARGEQSITVSAVFTVFAFLFVMLRMYTRLFMVRAIGVEDYCIVASMIFSIGFTTCIGVQVRYGLGKHHTDLTDSGELIKMMKAFYVSIIAYNLSLSFTKVSILLQYRRVFTKPKFVMAVWITFAIVIVYSVWAALGSVFQCLPISAFWTQDHSKCIDQFVAWFFNASANIVSDLVIIILPMPVIRDLNLRRRQKNLLMGVFAVGGFVCVVSIIRLHSLVGISNSKDPTWDNAPAASWSSVEVNVAIVCSSLPCIRPLLSRWLPQLFTSKYKSTPRSIPFERSTYGRHTDIGVALSELRKNSPSRSSDLDSPTDAIKVVTEVSVNIDSVNSKEGNDSLRMQNAFERESSTESLVQSPRSAVRST
ncbi:hypothetical protein BU23DRAFT_530988 [Bimuria novae-zelandiae CBS 107.79]|uniref:Rhodopsin domain-containing protein n=1 Tax=Bimuria novae-zelandiae CBS 107.79 TaxID=1447943 RepID=A0A6A5VE94_9PLEO|nr:hypothetical protein BU23DRAFT_530988 [Bimuria novae-zelandiae CBS 107.79]